ncbi:MAG: Do family serine endopeptidase [Verrucomicrobiae bacterium]|nr:Do family serine endopeptidase [Verrucomicrobiae bacterium]
MNRPARVALLAGLLLAAAGGIAFTQKSGAGSDGKPAGLKLVVDEGRRPGEGAASLKVTFAPVVREVTPSVVSISTETRPRRVEGRGPAPEMHPWFREFFGDRFPGGPGRPMITPRQHGLGSGVIVTEDGYILTNNHVIEGADAITVTLNPDGKEFVAKVVGRDPQSDLAVLKIEANGLAAIRLGDSDGVEVGDVVLAIGNPFGVGQTVTMGIVGATGRALTARPVGLQYQDFIQTDAAINPGNSGGALVDVAGRLIGINTAIVSSGGGNNGVGFAVPSNLARSVLEGLVEHGRVVRGFLGVNIQGLNPMLAEQFGLPEGSTTGALVAEVTPRSPAERSGIQSGDVIRTFDGREVRDGRHLTLLVGQTPPAKEVTVGLYRDGKPREVSVVLEERSESRQLAGLGGRGGPASAADIGGLQGVVVADLTANLRQQYRIPRDVTGALVTGVDGESAAAAAGLREGDVIREINRRSVRDAEAAIEAVQGLENARILLRIWREGGTLFLGVDERRQG